MKVLHTSDWHLGASLRMERRQEEFERTLAWLLALIREREVGALIVSGDVFDGYVPSNEASKLYYGFLMDACRARVREIVVTAGNHDSPTYLEAPKPVLERLSVHVVGHFERGDLDSMLVPLADGAGETAAVVCAVPYLRERDIRSFQAGESLEEDRDRHLAGVAECYSRLCGRCRERYPGVPMIATGHFYATGGRSSGDRVVGTLGSVSLQSLPQDVAYYALGHLHLPQTVAGRPNWRYSGSLLPMNFADTAVRKSVALLDTADLTAEPELVEVPGYQRLQRLSGSVPELVAALEELKKEGAPVWVQAENTGSFEPELPGKLAGVCRDSQVKVLVCRNRELNPLVAERGMFKGERLAECRPRDVFQEILAGQEVPPRERQAMLEVFQDIERELDERETAPGRTE